MSFPRYPKYRSTRVAELGDIPEHWTITHIKRIGKLKGGAGFPHDKQGLEGEELSFHKVNALAQADANGRLLASDNTISRETAQSLGAFIFPPRTIVFAKVGAAMLLGRIRMLAHEACIDNNMMGLVPSSSVSGEYLRYAMTLVRFDLIANPGAVPSVNEGQIGNVAVALPPLSEQFALAAFLDRETAKIDALIAEQQRLMELLQEKQQAVISRAVTKGLNSDAPMKPSGMEWLGDVPAHWTVMPIGRAAKLESGHTPSRSHHEYWENCTIPWFTLADVWQIRERRADYITETAERISELGLANSSARLLPRGTVMLSRTASVGFSAIMDVPMATTQDFANWICGSALKPEYLLLTLRSMTSEFRRLMMGSTHNTIYMPDIQSLRLVLPPMDEQERIVTHVRTRVADIDALSADVDSAIVLLKERRSALITAAVTGQMDVREAVTQEAA